MREAGAAFSMKTNTMTILGFFPAGITISPPFDKLHSFWKRSLQRSLGLILKEKEGGLPKNLPKQGHLSTLQVSGQKQREKTGNVISADMTLSGGITFLRKFINSRTAAIAVLNW